MTLTPDLVHEAVRRLTAADGIFAVSERRVNGASQIENVAYRHPSVKEVAVFGVPNELMGEELAMVCHPQPGSALTEHDLHAHLLNALPSFKVPKYLALTDEPLPRNASEKIHRLALRNSFVAT